MEACGFSLAEGNFFEWRFDEIIPENFKECANRVGSRSWFHIDRKVVSPSYGVITLDPRIEPSENQLALINEFQRELVLIYAEEWIHAYQNALGSCVSKKGVLLDVLKDAHEIDAVQFLIEQRVPISKGVYLDRYERATAIEQLKGFQVERELQEIEQVLSTLSPGECMVIGRDPNSVKNTNYRIERDVSAEERDSLGPVRASMRENIYTSISSSHCCVEALGDGNYKISSAKPNVMPKNGIFVPDDFAIWREMEEGQELIVGPGTPVRLGRFFQFSLPR